MLKRSLFFAVFLSCQRPPDAQKHSWTFLTSVEQKHLHKIYACERDLVSIKNLKDKSLDRYLDGVIQKPSRRHCSVISQIMCPPQQACRIDTPQLGFWSYLNPVVLFPDEPLESPSDFSKVLTFFQTHHRTVQDSYVTWEKIEESIKQLLDYTSILLIPAVPTLESLMYELERIQIDIQNRLSEKMKLAIPKIGHFWTQNFLRQQHQEYASDLLQELKVLSSLKHSVFDHHVLKLDRLLDVLETMWWIEVYNDLKGMKIFSDAVIQRFSASGTHHFHDHLKSLQTHLQWRLKIFQGFHQSLQEFQQRCNTIVSQLESLQSQTESDKHLKTLQSMLDQLRKEKVVVWGTTEKLVGWND